MGSRFCSKFLVYTYIKPLGSGIIVAVVQESVHNAKHRRRSLRTSPQEWHHLPEPRMAYVLFQTS